MLRKKKSKAKTYEQKIKTTKSAFEKPLSASAVKVGEVATLRSNVTEYKRSGH
jgi:hypothetical protein